MSDEELKKLAIDVTEGKVFGSWMIPEDKVDELLPVIFLPYHWGAADKLQNQDVSVIYEYLDKTKRKTPNGNPVFMSFKTLTSEERSKLSDFIYKLNQFKQQFLLE